MAPRPQGPSRALPVRLLLVLLLSSATAERVRLRQQLLERLRSRSEEGAASARAEDGLGGNASLRPQRLAGRRLPSLGERLVKKDAYCDCEHDFLGTYKTVAKCVQAVTRAGGKYFYYGKGLTRGGYCYLAYARSRRCPEGFKSSGYDFYDIPSIPDKEWLRCKVDAVMLRLASEEAPPALGLVYSDQYTDPAKMTLVSTVRALKLKGKVRHCQTDRRLHCLADTLEVQQWHRCCTPTVRGGNCTPRGKFELVDRQPALKGVPRLFGIGWKPFHKSFSVSVSAARPPLPSVERPSSFEARVAIRSQTLHEVFDTCPRWIKKAVQAFTAFNSASMKWFQYMPIGERHHPLSMLMGVSPASSGIDASVYGSYTFGMFVTAVHLFLRNASGSKLSPVERFKMPSRKAFVDRFVTFGYISSPIYDIDRTTEPVLDASTGCVFDALRRFRLKDHLDSGRNEWPHLLGTGDGQKTSHCPNDMPTCTKKEYTSGVFEQYTTVDGDPVYPRQHIDFSRNFRAADGPWSDQTERFLAFGHFGSHALRALEEGDSRGGETAAYVIETLDIAGLSLRPGFAAPGADMYFSREGLPLMVRTPAGEEVWKHKADEKTWQYWKFHWRSSLFLRVTLVDHLYATHFATGGMLAAAAREALPPEHPLRRLISMFTFGTVDINDCAMHQLVDSRALLHRASPFYDWHQVTSAAKDKVPPLKQRLGAFFGAGLPSELAQMPYYEDGQLLADALKDLVRNWTRLHAGEWCSSDGAVKDPDVLLFFERMRWWSLDKYNQAEDQKWLGLLTPDGGISCAGMEKYLAVLFFGVTGYHRHVGAIGDLGSDADFASWSWRDGEASGLPRQHLQMALVVAFTAKIQPKVNQDYAFLAQGLPQEREATEVLKRFQAAMTANAAEIDRRNAKRELPYLNMHPGEVECSVAV